MFDKGWSYTYYFFIAFFFVGVALNGYALCPCGCGRCFNRRRSNYQEVPFQVTTPTAPPVPDTTGVELQLMKAEDDPNEPAKTYGTSATAAAVPAAAVPVSLTKDVVLPAGNIGIQFTSVYGRGLRVTGMRPHCPVQGELKLGDMVTVLDGEDVRYMSDIDFTNHLKSRINFARNITVETR